jgi:hypothetical protein
LKQRADVGLVHGADVLLHPGPEHQVQLQPPGIPSACSCTPDGTKAYSLSISNNPEPEVVNDSKD